jgi:hypothetical protein
MKRNTQEVEEIALTLEHYNQHAAKFWQGGFATGPNPARVNPADTGNCL